MPQLELDAQTNDLTKDAVVTTSGVEKASGLLNGSEATAEAHWAALTDADLDDEITAYRQGIRDISNELQSLGVAVSIDEAPADAPAGPEDAEVTRRLRSCKLHCCTFLSIILATTRVAISITSPALTIVRSSQRWADTAEHLMYLLSLYSC